MNPLSIWTFWWTYFFSHQTYLYWEASNLSYEQLVFQVPTVVRCSQPTVARLPKQVGKIGEVELADDLSYGNPKWGTLVDPHFLWLVTFCLSSEAKWGGVPHEDHQYSSICWRCLTICEVFDDFDGTWESWDGDILVMFHDFHEMAHHPLGYPVCWLGLNFVARVDYDYRPWLMAMKLDYCNYFKIPRGHNHLRLQHKRERHQRI